MAIAVRADRVRKYQLILLSSFIGLLSYVDIGNNIPACMEYRRREIEIEIGNLASWISYKQVGLAAWSKCLHFHLRVVSSIPGHDNF